MSDGLAVPKQIEYVIAKRPRTRLPLAAILSLVVVAAVVGGILLARHFMGPRKFPALQLLGVGLKASLRTKWLNGSEHYIFQVRPTPGNEARFLTVLQTVPRDQLEFEIHLRDSDGFELCNSVPTMYPLLAPDGKPSAMKADQTFTNCTKDQVEAASQWHVTYRFPLLGADISTPRGTSETPDAVRKTQLTGADFQTGEVETMDAGSFKVLKRAEFDTLMGWRSPDEISLLCQGSACILTNLRTSGSVHAAKR